MYPTALWAVAAITTAPASTMPWIELAADISGVCSVAGTLLMTSKPTHRLSTKMMKSVRSMRGSSRSPGRWRIGRLRGPGIGRRERGMHHPALVGDHDSGHELVGQVDGELAAGDQVGEQRADVARVHGRSGGRHRRGQVVGTDDRDAVVGHDRLAGNGAFDVAAEVARSHVNQHRSWC